LLSEWGKKGKKKKEGGKEVMYAYLERGRETYCKLSSLKPINKKKGKRKRGGGRMCEAISWERKEKFRDFGRSLIDGGTWEKGGKRKKKGNSS